MVKDQCIRYYFGQGFDLYPEFKMNIDLGELVNTVMTRCYHDFCAGFPYLVRFDPGYFHPAVIILAHGQLPAATPAAMIVGSAGCHLNKLRHELV